MKNKILWIFLLLIISVGLVFYFKKNQSQKEEALLVLLRQQYSDKFTIKTWPIGNFLIVSAHSNTICCGENSTDHFDEKATPSVIIQDLKSQKIKSVYDVSFTNSGEEDRGNLIYSQKAEVGKDFLVAEWTISYGGSSGLKGFILFGNKDGQFKPITGYPINTGEKNSINLTDKLNGKRYSFPITGDSVFSEVYDLNNDGILDLLYADWKWDLEKGESHYQSRPWDLQVFELVDNKFEVAKWWNKGEVYKTEENIGYDVTDTSRLRQIFYEKSK